MTCGQLPHTQDINIYIYFAWNMIKYVCKDLYMHWKKVFTSLNKYTYGSSPFSWKALVKKSGTDDLGKMLLEEVVRGYLNADDSRIPAIRNSEDWFAFVNVGYFVAMGHTLVPIVLNGCPSTSKHDIFGFHLCPFDNQFQTINKCCTSRTKSFGTSTKRDHSLCRLSGS